MAQTIQDGVSEAQKLEDLTGMGIPESEYTHEETKSEEVKPEVKAESKPEPKSKDDSEEDDSIEGDEEEESEDEGENERENKRSVRSAKKSSPIKAIFSIIKEIQRDLATLKAPPAAKQEVKEAIDEIAEFAKTRELDGEALTQLTQILQKKIMNDLEKSGKLGQGVPKEIQDKLKELEDLKKESTERKEIEHFEKEWSSLVVDLQKQYPNAKAGELAEARKLMDELSHSKEWAKYDLDYVLYKNKSQFDTLLKVAKVSKSGETSSKQIVEHDDEEDIDLDPENMTPEKMKAYEKRKYSQPREKPQIVG